MQGFQVGNDRDYKAALRRLRGPKTNITPEAALIKVVHSAHFNIVLDGFLRYLCYIETKVCSLIILQEYTATAEQISEDNLFSVFQMKYAFALTISLGLMALASFGGTNGILFYAGAIFESSGVPFNIGTVSMALIQVINIEL